MHEATSNSIHSRTWSLATFGLLLAPAGITGCGANQIFAVGAAASGSSASVGIPLTGHISTDGTANIAHASIQLYAAGTAAYASAARPLLPSAVLSDTLGGFDIHGAYTCPSSTAQVYLVATGGDAGNGNNPNLALMTALGPCANVDTFASIAIDEATTIAAVYALAPFMASATNVGVGTVNSLGLAHAFATAARLADIATGVIPGALPSGTTAPIAELNTLADILAACVDTTGGVAGDSTACGKLFAAATPAAGSSPADTLSAALNIAKNPGRNVATLLSTVPTKAPFQPTIAQATDLTISIKYRPTLSKPSAAAIDAAGNIWVTNLGNNTVSLVDATGSPVPGSPFLTGNLSQPSAVVIDAAGNAWVTNSASSTLSVFTPGGLGALTGAPNLSTPEGIAIDAKGQLWISNSGNNSVSQITVSGTAYKSSATYSNGGINTPHAIAINPF